LPLSRATPCALLLLCRSAGRAALLLLLLLSGAARAGDPVAGMALFNNIPDSVISCSNSSCHGPNPNDNVNGLQRGGNNPGVIQTAIKMGVTQMMFLNGLLNPFQLDDLSAFLAPQPDLAGNALAFDAQTAGTTSAPQGVTLRSIGGVNLVVTAITVSGANAADFSAGGSCTAGINLLSTTIQQAGGSCDLVVSFHPSAAGPRSGTVTLFYAGASTFPGTQTIAVTGLGKIAAAPVASIAPATIDFGEIVRGSTSAPRTITPRDAVCTDTTWSFGARVTIANNCQSNYPAANLNLVEYFNTELNHYFMTADPAERQDVETGRAGPGWGQTLALGHVWDTTPAPKLTPVCRFYGNPALGPGGKRLGPNSHFYTADPDECAAVKEDPGWIFEGVVFHAVVPNQGTCPPLLVPVYRSYNGRFPENDSNHRYATDPAIIQQMSAQKWVSEGAVFCIAPE
jgi:hypothetical protein